VSGDISHDHRFVHAFSGEAMQQNRHVSIALGRGIPRAWLPNT
jgi:hypothetical protein